MPSITNEKENSKADIKNLEKEIEGMFMGFTG